MNWKEPKILQFGACTIVIHRPELSDADKSRLEQSVKTSLESVMQSYVLRKERSNGNRNKTRIVR